VAWCIGDPPTDWRLVWPQRQQHKVHPRFLNLHAGVVLRETLPKPYLTTMAESVYKVIELVGTSGGVAGRLESAAG